MSILNAWLLILIAAINSTIGNLFLKKSSSISEGLVSMLLNRYFIAGLIFYGVNVLLFAKALEKLPVSAAYPVLAGVSFLILVLISQFLLGENLSMYQITGVGLILMGVIFVVKA